MDAPFWAWGYSTAVGFACAALTAIGYELTTRRPLTFSIEDSERSTLPLSLIFSLPLRLAAGPMLVARAMVAPSRSSAGILVLVLLAAAWSFCLGVLFVASLIPPAS